MGVLDPDAKAALMDTARRLAQERAPTTSIAGTVPVLAIGSGKGGVGKSSVTANLAVALADLGHVVGVIDADVGGFSLPRLLGIARPARGAGRPARAEVARRRRRRAARRVDGLPR